jgi:2-alkenal reductase
MLSRIKRSSLSALLILLLGMAIGFGIASPARMVSGQQAVSDEETQLLRDIYAKVNPSVVSITVRIPAGRVQPNPFGQRGGVQPFAMAAGSGFVYDTAGHIVTNAHVVQGADQVEVTFSDDTMMRAKIVGIDLDSDLAVIQVQGDASRYKPLTLANSDELAVGDRAIAIGNPFERAGTMTQGIVSGLHRSVDALAQTSSGGSYTIPDAVQTDAALNPGNSGGPLLNNRGEVIGVNEQIASQVQQSSGVSFAIPSNLVKMIADTLIKDGKVTHSWLGISGGTLTLDLNEQLNLPADTHGAYVGTVQPNSPAAKAGLKGGSETTNVNGNNLPVGGDVIVAVDKNPVRHFDDLTSYLFMKTKVGQTVTLTVLRNGKQQDIQVTLGARPTSQTS